MKKILIYLPYTWPTISTRFFKSFLELTRYPIPDTQVDVCISNTFPLDRNRNEMCDRVANATKYQADYLLMVDGDNILPPDALERLLEHCSDEYPVVSGLYFRKTPPYKAVPGHYGEWEKHETMRGTIESMGFVDKNGEQCLMYQPVKDFDTIQQIDVAGCGCLLVRTDVFAKLEQPFFRYHNPYTLGGDFSLDHTSEEMEFFCKLRKAEIKTLLVPTVRAGHEVLRVIGCIENGN